jgi:ribosomal protein L11
VSIDLGPVHHVSLRERVGWQKQLLEIVELKKKDLNAVNPDNAARMIAPRDVANWRI